MAQVKVLGPSVTKHGEFKGRDGESIDYTTVKQPAVLTLGEFKFPLDVRIEEGVADYAPGLYELDIESMLTCQKGALAISKFTKLRPLK